MLPNPSRIKEFIVLAFCSVFVTAAGFSSELPRRGLCCPISVVAVHREHVYTPASSLTERILARLAERELEEADPWLRDDLRIAWITVLNASRGEDHPHFWATYTVLRMHPDQVWPAIVAQRRAALGAHYEEFFGAEELAGVPAKKPAQSVTGKKEIRRMKAA